MIKHKNIDFTAVKFDNGFWKYRFDLNRDVSLKCVCDRFEKNGRFDSVRFRYKEDKKYLPHVFYDSDFAKWAEAVSYLISNGEKMEYEQQIIDSIVLKLEENQLENGYLNSYFIQVALDKIFTDRSLHELYCAGHFIESAIAYDKATGKDKYLKIILKYVDCIERAFITEKTAKFITPGHQEIELALIKLYEYTGNKKYLDMSKFFIDNRNGDDQEIYQGWYNKKIIQSEKPVRELVEAEGHCVRETYLLTAMAELALKTGDKDLLNACERVYKDIIDKKLYITGGIGSERISESFTVPYDLPNLEAYTETCASIGLMIFSLAMLKNKLKVEYAHLIERVMYNELLSSTSMSGKEFFYENPLEIHLESVGKEKSVVPEKQTKLPITKRAETFPTTCCPPNINRIIARLGDFFFMENGDDLVINQYADLSLDTEGAQIKMISNYPCDGRVQIKINKCNYKKIYLRIPEWCENYKVNAKCDKENGYLIFDGNIKEIIADFKMQPYFIECNPNVRANTGRVALCYGPIVYCIERLDNPYPLNSLSVNQTAKIKAVKNPDYIMTDLIVDGFVDDTFNGLYQKSKGKKTKIKLKYKPYWTFANREECDMLVWVRRSN